jgi:pimeloyl-ACP methyl ester carboxylesterase
MAGQGPAGFEEITFTARDGLRLYARRYPAARPQPYPVGVRSVREASRAEHKPPRARPVLCLAGLTRNSRDFHDLARALATAEPISRTVYTLDYRGRGRSEHDPDWKNYAIPIELLDVVDFMAAYQLADSAIVGTSRGGLIAMLMAAAQPSLIGALVLNDIGPVIERDGLARIAGYVGRTPTPASWEDAARIVAGFSARAFPAVPAEQWSEVARAWFNERDGRPAPGYDPKLGRAISVTDGPPPALWPQFTALACAPLLVLRGQNSDLLSEATVAEMCRRHPDCAAATVPGQGHAPLLKDLPTMTAIARFLIETDAGQPVAGRRFLG